MKTYSFVVKNRTIFHRFILTFFVEDVAYSMYGDDMNATQLQPMQTARIKALHLEEKEIQRLFYLGFYQGGCIQFLQVAPLQDPYLFYVQGSMFMLRKRDAQRIEVELV